MSVIGFGFIIETYEDVLRLYSTHDAFEQTRLSAAVPAEHTCHPAGLSSDEGALKDLQPVEFQMDTIYKEPVNGLHCLETL